MHAAIDAAAELEHALAEHGLALLRGALSPSFTSLVSPKQIVGMPTGSL
jgi:hypothetical protein